MRSLLTMQRVRRSGAGTSATYAASQMGAAAAVLAASRRFFADRPATFSEIAEALKVLGVSITVTDKELKKQYHQLVKKHHPDAGGCEKQMSKISVAYETISNLSAKDKDQFNLQKGSYTASSGHSQRGGFQSSRGGSGAYRRPYEDTYNTNFHRQQEYARAHAQQRGAGFYNFRGAASGGPAGPDPFAQNPFTARHPFSMGSNFRQFGAMSFNQIFLRGLMLYFLVSLLVASLYRSYRDWANDDGWKMAESLSRHEQLAELHRIRQEMKERMTNVERSREDAYQREGLGTFAGPFRRQQALQQDAERIKELRALEYAQKRQMDLETQAREMRGWPKFDPSKGVLMKFENDPVGVVYFEPRVPSLSQANMLSMDQRASSNDPNAMEGVPQGPNNSPQAARSKSAILEEAMQEQHRQQAEFVAQQQRQQQQQGMGGHAGVAPPTDTFKFQETFVPPNRSSPV